MEIIQKILAQMPPDVGTCPSDPMQMKLDAINALPGAMKGCDCPKCKNKGYVAIVDDKAMRCVNCSCMPKRRSLLRIAKSGLQSALQDYTFEAFQTPEPWQAEAKAKAQRYAENPDDKWFLACGAVGCGKTHLCTAICGALLDAGIELRYMRWRDEAVGLKAVVNDGAEYAKRIEPLKKVHALYIDDFLKMPKQFDEATGRAKDVLPTQADINLAFEILNARYTDKRLITLISTERTPEKLLDIDEAVGSRIYERSRGNTVRITGGNKNWRLK